MARGSFIPLLTLTLCATAAAEATPDDDACPAGSPGCATVLDDQVDLMQLRTRVAKRDALEPARAVLEPAHLGVQKHIAGVPVYNYHLAYPSGANPSAVELAKPLSWVVSLSDTLTDTDVHAFCAGLPGGAKCTGEGHPSEGGLSYIAITATEKELADILSKHKGAEAVEPDLPVDPIPEIDVEESLIQLTGADVPWGLDRIDDEDGLDQSYSPNGGDGVHVYVLDTGVRTTHTDFEGRAIPTLESLGTVTPCTASMSNCQEDTHGHGTHCAGTIAGKTYGVAKQAIIHGVKVLNPSGYTSWITGAMDWVAANRGSNPAVISMSLGGPGQSNSYKTAVEAAVNQGITVVIAAGNSNSDACNFSPAFVPAAITVGSTTHADTMSGFSNYGTCVDIFAPGSSIKSAGKASDTASATMSGTSMACPHVAGVVALVLTNTPQATPAEITNLITSGARQGKISSLPAAPEPASPNLLLNAILAGVETTTQPPPSYAKWEVESGDCSLADGPDGDDCVQSPNYPSSYSDNHKCVINTNHIFFASRTINVATYNTEAQYDKLTVNGVSYTGTDGPNGIKPVASITWSADNSVVKGGWKICAGEGGAGPAPTPTPPTPPPATPAPTPAPTTPAPTPAPTTPAATPAPTTPAPTPAPTTPAPTPAPPSGPSNAAWMVDGDCVLEGDNCVKSRNFPEKYPDKEKCVIKAKGAFKIKIEPSEFSTERQYDWLKLGSTKYSGASGPDGQDTTAGQEITWSADYSVTKRGWRMCKEQ
jgi:subtilisin family serine protease